jgi:hypothetical protein
MSKNYLELHKYFPKLLETNDTLSTSSISEPVEDFKDDLQINFQLDDEEEKQRV